MLSFYPERAVYHIFGEMVDNLCTSCVYTDYVSLTLTLRKQSNPTNRWLERCFRCLVPGACQPVSLLRGKLFQLLSLGHMPGKNTFTSAKTADQMCSVPDVSHRKHRIQDETVHEGLPTSFISWLTCFTHPSGMSLLRIVYFSTSIRQNRSSTALVDQLASTHFEYKV